METMDASADSKPVFGSITRQSAPARQQVLDLLRSAIAEGTIAPNTRLVEHELCEQFGVSRTTVREALRELEAERLVSSVPGKGVVVTALAPEDVVDLYQVRASLEGLAARLFVENAPDSLLEQLATALSHVTELAQTGTSATSLVAKDEFYEVLFRGAGNRVLRDLGATIETRVRQLRTRTLRRPGRPEESCKELEAVMEAIRRRDADLAERRCREHVESAGRVLKEMLASEGMHFDGSDGKR
ncbi:MAG: GntR family transcriptional regulator [Actinobacteria bacterium]|nr:GntR family transcriptional regulator [Actinomycetota bacterium]